MALRKILLYPDPRLRRTASPVDEVNAEIRTLVDDMAETMYQAPGLGLAAIQVDVAKHVIVIDISKERNALHVFINPAIYYKEGNQMLEEGCLSVPGIFEPVSRAERIRVRALDRDGKPFDLEATGLLSVCIQHEVDHLDGKIFVDYISRLKQGRIRKKLEKQQRLAM
ncbi:MAG: peptide deformylase [Gammaproteobacteria bacterium]|nr:MAG: peptide deformylase [Gammaproteobacteria bacterium]